MGGLFVLPATTETVAWFIAAEEAAPEELSTIANVMPAPAMPSPAMPSRKGELMEVVLTGWGWKARAPLCPVFRPRSRAAASSVPTRVASSRAARGYFADVWMTSPSAACPLELPAFFRSSIAACCCSGVSTGFVVRAPTTGSFGNGESNPAEHPARTVAAAKTMLARQIERSWCTLRLPPLFTPRRYTFHQISPVPLPQAGRLVDSSLSSVARMRYCSATNHHRTPTGSR